MGERERASGEAFRDGSYHFHGIRIEQKRRPVKRLQPPLPERTLASMEPTPAAMDAAPTASERIAKLEGTMDGLKSSIDGLRHGQNLTIGVLGLVAAIMLAGFAYVLQRVDDVDNKVTELPDRINRNLLELNRTLSDAITASRAVQQTPPIIVFPPYPDPRDNPPATGTPRQ